MSAAAQEDGQPEGEGADAAAQPRKKWGGKRIVLFIVLPLLLLIGGGAGAYFSGLLGGAKDQKAEEQAPKKEEPPTPSVYVELPEMLVNLEASGKQQRFLKTSISVEVGSDKDADALKKVMPRLVDQFQTYLRGLRVEDLHGSAGVYRLRQELLTRCAQAADPVPVRDVLFKELLVQ